MWILHDFYTLFIANHVTAGFEKSPSTLDNLYPPTCGNVISIPTLVAWLMTVHEVTYTDIRHGTFSECNVTPFVKG